MNRKTMKAVKILAYVVMTAVLCAQSLIVKAEDSSSYGDYVVTVYNEQNGLPTGEANVVIQTLDGYVWIGSYGGLIRYDGTDFKNYSEEKEGIASSSVRTLFEDSKGRLWIGTNDAGVYTYEHGVFTKINNQDDHTFLCIRDFAEDSDGIIYAASNSGLAKIEGDILTPISNEAVNGNTVYSLGVDCYGRLWCSMNQGICTVIENEQVAEQLSSDLFFDEAEIYCASSGSQGEIYLGSSGNEFVRLDFTDKDFDENAITVKHYQTGGVTTHNQIRAYEDGTILISGLRGVGLLQADGNFMEFGENKKASSVNGAALDYEGNIWLASSTLGIVKYTKGCFSTPNEAAGLSGKAINTVVSTGKEFYVGLDDGLLAFNNSWEPVENPLTELLRETRVRHIMVAEDKTLWVATYYGHGVIHYNPVTQKLVCYGEAEGLVSEGARVLLQLADGSVAVGTQGGISIIHNETVVKNYEKSDDGLSNATILCLAQDEAGVLYAGTDGGGIFAISGDTIISYGFSEGLGEGVVLRLLQDKAGPGWFVSAGSSLYYLENGVFRKLDNFDKSAGSIFDIYMQQDSVYMMQNSGILKVDRDALLGEEFARTVQYGFPHGLTGSLNANTWNCIDEEGILYLSTRSGISCFGFSEKNEIRPRGIISDLFVDDTVYTNYIENGIHLDRNATRLTIHFSTLSYTGTTNSGMSYQLEGFDEAERKIENEKSSSISYTNLPGGDYRFRLEVYLLEDPQNTLEYCVDIHKDKKMTEYPLFWILGTVLCLVLVILICVAIARSKIARASRRQKEYQTIIDQFLRAFAKTIDAKDTYTNGHSIRVAYYSKELAKRMNLSAEEQERVYYIALMHDIGKIGIPDSILKKAAKLTDEEMDVIKTHPVIGGEILKDCTALTGISEGARYHHERYDGNGYCEGLKGNNIPLVARIIGVADSYDAMSNARCYRRALDKDIIIRELKNGAGSQFDPEIVPIMLQMMAENSVPVDLDGNPLTR